MVATWGDIATISVSKRDESWRTLRRMRSSPPGAAGVDEARAATFQAALEQSEQLFRAAEAVGPEVRPMLVFYGLSQAGRAIAAASPRLSDKEWRLTGHGVSVKETRDQVNIGKVAIEAHKGGSPQAVAAALGSRFLPPKASVQLEELWLLIPEANEELLPAVGHRVAETSPAFLCLGAVRSTQGVGQGDADGRSSRSGQRARRKGGYQMAVRLPHP